MKETLKSQYLVTLFFAGMFLLNYPLMGIYNINKKLLGIPVLYLFVFALWLMVILLTYWIIRKTKNKKDA
ncbi:hypothetical protein [Mongoliibacter ruber]|uniref:DUF3311 domain-containing protein n=1 Tax=Mongoliibacter ruber TaxID=1750599 RepID=A0A2T0WH43_9BACT|nr:hypothetical protein [Mongoliibacter ruber]PRY85975.1 hypothetical protein CLW00_110107 [Mongoliibacter ruber]